MTRSDPYRPTLGDVVWFMASKLASDDPEWAPPVKLALERMPPGFVEAVETELEQQRSRMRAHGWTDAALDDVESNIIWAPPDATSLECDLHLLNVLGALRPRRTAA